MSANNDVVLVDRRWVVDEIRDFHKKWKVATEGHMEAVTVDLNLLFKDIITIVSHLGDDPTPQGGDDRHNLHVKGGEPASSR